MHNRTTTVKCLLEGSSHLEFTAWTDIKIFPLLKRVGKLWESFWRGFCLNFSPYVFDGILKTKIMSVKYSCEIDCFKVWLVSLFPQHCLFFFISFFFFFSLMFGSKKVYRGYLCTFFRSPSEKFRGGTLDILLLLRPHGMRRILT